MTLQHKIIYMNGTEADLRLTVEPWAEQFIVGIGKKVEIIVQGDHGVSDVELEQLPGGLIVYGYAGCLIRVFADGNELSPVPQK